MKQKRRESRSGKAQQNKPILRLTYAVAAVFLCLIAYFLWFVQIESKNVIGNTYNPRVNLMADRVVRGKIKTADGVILAKTETDEAGNETRVYPHGELFAPVTGYMQKGKTGIESLANFYLLSSNVNTLEQVKNELIGQKNIGDNVWLTIDYQLTAAASEALGERNGAVIAMEPDTGRVRCMVSKPSFDPNTIAEDWETLTAEENDAGQLLNRAAQGAYPPGSTFKLVTLLEYVHEHPADWEDFRFTCTGSYTNEDGNTIRCFGGAVHGEQTLSEAFANSCNGAFAKIGAELSAESMQKLASELLFNAKLPFSLPYTKSRFLLSDADSTFIKEQTAIGQGETTMSPLHNLLLTSAIANGGVLMRPMFIDYLENAGGQNFKYFSEQAYGAIMSAEDAALLAELMRTVVTEGTGSAFRDAGYAVYAKTGSAEYESEAGMKTHAWCNAFAENGGKKLAVCVIVEDGQSGGATAAPIARRVLDAYMLPE